MRGKRGIEVYAIKKVRVEKRKKKPWGTAEKRMEERDAKGPSSSVTQPILSPVKKM